MNRGLDRRQSWPLHFRLSIFSKLAFLPPFFFLSSSLPSFLPSFLPPSLPPSLPSFLPSSFLPSFLPSFLCQWPLCLFHSGVFLCALMWWDLIWIFAGWASYKLASVFWKLELIFFSYLPILFHKAITKIKGRNAVEVFCLPLSKDAYYYLTNTYLTFILFHSH